MSEPENLPAVVDEHERKIQEARATPGRSMAVLPSPDEWAGITTMARTICTTELVPRDYRNRPDAVIAAILMGREIGIGPMESMRSITIIDGRPTLSAALMLSKMRQNGVIILESKIDDERAWIRAQRSDTGEIAEVEWTYAEAEQIERKGKKLTEGDNWKNYRQDMLWARCTGRLARRLGSDLLAGNLYSTEEVKDFDDPPSGATYDSVNDGSSGYFNRAEQLLPGAIRTSEGDKGVPTLIMEQLNLIDPTVDWPATISAVMDARFAVKELKLIPENEVKEFWIRLSNATQRAGKDMTGDFPPVAPEVIIEAFVWAFEIESVDLVVKGEVEQPADGEPAAEEAQAEDADAESVVPAPDPDQLAADAAATDFGEADK